MGTKIIFRSSYTSSADKHENIRALKGFILKDVGNGTIEGIAKKTFPQMEADMKKLMDGWKVQGAIVGQDRDSVYNKFWYSKASKLKSTSKSLSFKNTSAHVMPLISGVNERYTPWYVGDWLKKVASSGQLKSKRIIKYKGQWPKFISGIGEKNYREKRSIRDKIDVTKRKISDLEAKGSKRFKGKAKQIKKLKNRLGRPSSKKYNDNTIQKYNVAKTPKVKATGLYKKLEQSKGPRPTQTLIKGESKRDFWNPVMSAYFGKKYDKGNNVHISPSGTVSKNIHSSIITKLRKRANITSHARSGSKNQVVKKRGPKNRTSRDITIDKRFVVKNQKQNDDFYSMVNGLHILGAQQRAIEKEQYLKRKHQIKR